MPASDTTTIDLHTERPTAGGWRYHARVTVGGHTREHVMTLSWPDHDYWCGGAWPPSTLVERLLALLLANLGRGEAPASLPRRFDCATARRWLPEIDDWLREGSGSGGVSVPG